MTDETKPNNNMRIWNEVREVPSEMRKPFSIGARALTAIDPMFLFMKATEQWGPMGEGWGFEILKDAFVNKDGKPEHVLHIMEVKLWYRRRFDEVDRRMTAAEVVDRSGGGGFTFGVGCTKVFMGTPSSTHGMWVDDEFNKKTLTDALTNALSRLGFGAEVRMGKFEGGKYNDLMSDEDAALARAWEKYIEWRRKAKGITPDRATDAMIISSAIEYLQENSRRVEPATIAALMEE